MNRLLTLLAALAAVAIKISGSDANLWSEFENPSVGVRTKVWWFHGETTTTKSGILADLSEFKAKGIGGIVFYDQVHGKADGAFDSMSPEWWDMLKYSATKAKELGLTFEVAASNGYVGGGPWITPELAMKKTVFVDTLVEARADTVIHLTAPSGFRDIATVMFPDRRDWLPIVLLDSTIVLKNNNERIIEFSADSLIEVRGVSYTVNPRGKGSTGSMNIPGKPRERYFAAKYVDLPPIGTLEYSQDGNEWNNAATLLPVEAVIGHKSNRRTISFPAVKCRYLRFRIHDWVDSTGEFSTLRVGDINVFRRDIVDNIETKSGLRTEVTYPAAVGGNIGAVKKEDIKVFTGLAADDGVLAVPVPAGTWRVIRAGYTPTGARTKHGRRNMLGYEADVMSAEAARIQFDNYFKAISDTLAAIGCPPSGMCMDSHEAGIQNWTSGFETRFSRRRGYDLLSRIPALAGYIVETRDETESFLLDFRKTIAETIASEYYGTFASLCHARGATFTSQAMLNIETDNIAARGQVDKPQGEFWAYQTNGNYDCLDAASSAHLYGHKIASGEAFTDTPYHTTWAELLRIANIAYCRGINEFAVCASSYQPWLDHKYDDSGSAHPYVFHRFHPEWESSGSFWDYQARCAAMLRHGKPVVDLCVYIGEDLPLKTMSYKLPEIPGGYNFDVANLDALINRMSANNGSIAVKGGMNYKALVVQDRTFISPEAEAKIEMLANEGVPVVRCDRGEKVSDILERAGIAPDITLSSGRAPDDCVLFFHRQGDDCNIYFVYNHSRKIYDDYVTLRDAASKVELWNPEKVSRINIPTRTDGSFHLHLEPHQSLFIIAE